VPFDQFLAKGPDGVVSRAIAALNDKAKEMGTSVNGWRIPRMNIAAFGTDYETSVLIAVIALSANLPADSLL
jgi:hypothetical protein